MITTKQIIVKEIQKILKDLTNQDIIPNLEHPKDEKHGDYSTNIAMALFSNQESGILRLRSGQVRNQEWKSPLELAKKISDQFMIHNSKFIIPAQSEAVAPGFINFFLSKNYLIANLEKILGGNKYGSKLQNPNKKIVVEYSSPNIAKPFTVGHLRSTIIGDAVANLLEANGWKVYRDNHIGDWGSQFGKQIYAIKQWGNEEKILKSVNPVKELFDLYVRFHQEVEKDPSLEEEGRKWFKKLEDGDVEAKELWKKCVEWSLKEFQKIYDQLGIWFTENNGIGYGESFFEDKMQAVTKELENKGILKESEGAKLVFFPKDPSTGSGQAKYPPLMIIKKDGATLYATRDLATDKFRLKKYGKDVVIINEVGIEQSLYFKQLFEVEKMLGWVKDGQRIYLKHGHYRFKDEKMSTRKGNVIWLEEVLSEAVKRAYRLTTIKGEQRSGFVKGAGNMTVSEIFEQGLNKTKELFSEDTKLKVQQIGIGALKWNDLKRGSNLDIIFDWDEILNMDGNSGPYLQYTYARTQSVLAKLKTQNSKLKTTIQNSKVENEEVSLLRSLYRFPEVVGEAAENFAPNLLCNYLFDLAQKFNLFYQKLPILDSEQREFRLVLTAAVGQIIKNGLYLLGIAAPERM